jgi:hypothetical protein
MGVAVAPVSCARPSCQNVVWVDADSDLCSECAEAEKRAMYAVDFDHLARMDEHYPEHRTRHDRPARPSLSLVPYMGKASDDPRGTRYGLAGLRAIIQRLAARDDRNNGLFFAARCAGELVAGGQLDGAYTLDTLIEAAEQLAPDERWKSKDTVARGIRIGLENPRVPRRAA